MIKEVCVCVLVAHNHFIIFCSFFLSEDSFLIICIQIKKYIQLMEPVILRQILCYSYFIILSLIIQVAFRKPFVLAEGTFLCIFSYWFFSSLYVFPGFLMSFAFSSLQMIVLITAPQFSIIPKMNNCFSTMLFIIHCLTSLTY